MAVDALDVQRRRALWIPELGNASVLAEHQQTPKSETTYLKDLALEGAKRLQEPGHLGSVPCQSKVTEIRQITARHLDTYLTRFWNLSHLPSLISTTLNLSQGLAHVVQPFFDFRTCVSNTDPDSVRHPKKTSRHR